MLKSSDLDFSIIYSGKSTNGKSTGKYKTGKIEEVKEMRIWKQVNKNDTTQFMLNMIQEEKLIKEAYIYNI